MASIPPETRLTRPALVVGMAALELGATDALIEDSVLVGMAAELLPVLAVALLLLLVEVVMVLVEVVMVVILVMLSEELLMVVCSAEVEVDDIAADEVLGPALEEEATAEAP